MDKVWSLVHKGNRAQEREGKAYYWNIALV